MFSGANQFKAFLEQIPPMEKGSATLPEKLYEYIEKLVNERCFELLIPLYKTIQQEWAEKINPAGTLNAILMIACKDYNEVEFDELRKGVEFDVNHQIQPQQSLLSIAALNGNIALTVLLAKRHATVDKQLIENIQKHPHYSKVESHLPFIKGYLEEACLKSQSSVGMHVK